MGAMASKKASASAPVSARSAWPSAGEVSGPVAKIQRPEAGSAVTSSSTTVTRGCARSRSVTASEKGSRSMASALPAGSLWASAIAINRPPAARISQCRRPTAFCSSSSERNEFEQTISASLAVRCAKVPTLGRISWITAGSPASAICQAASAPAMPPPTMWIGSLMRREIGRIGRKGKGRRRAGDRAPCRAFRPWRARSGPGHARRPAAGRRRWRCSSEAAPAASDRRAGSGRSGR